VSEPRFHPPRFDQPVDVGGQIALLPPKATVKGLFLADAISRVRAVAPNHWLITSSTEIGGRRYVPFFDYPYRDYMRLLESAAEALYPKHPRGEGLRRLGRGAYDALLGSQVGRVLFGVLGADFDGVVRVGAKAYQISLSFGRFELEPMGERHMRFHFREFPALLETYQVGVFEGAMRACEVDGEVLVYLRDLANGTFDLRWRPR
jgi:uncharacterized protein (TIGR02265 family)